MPFGARQESGCARLRLRSDSTSAFHACLTRVTITLSRFIACDVWSARALEGAET